MGQGFLDGMLRPSIKSAPPPAQPWVPGTPMVVVGSTLESAVFASWRDVLLCLHPPYGIDKVNASLHRLAHLMVPLSEDVAVAMLDLNENSFDVALLPDVEVYSPRPTLLLVTGG